MTTQAPDATRRRDTAPRRRIAVVPVYNEEATVVGVLDHLEPLVDEIVVVDDGSTDRSRELILGWAQSRSRVQTVLFDRNRGLSAAYHAAFSAIAERVKAGELDADDAIITVDADGQHRPEDLDRLLDRLYGEPCDAVVARRDLSGYSWFKRLGNWLLSIWATLWAGCRLYDVESGLRVFRAAPLMEALEYYIGYRYSETVEVAVVLARLGYRISNDVLVPVPVSRSRTRLRDGVIDALAMIGAWWRTIAGRRRPQGLPKWAVYAMPALPAAGLLFIVVDLLMNPLFLGGDSMQHYSHVWYLSDQMFNHADIPLRIAALNSGQALLLPYAVVPYLLGAILYPAFGNWAVTLLMAVVVLGVVYAAGLARPIMKEPWFVILFLLNPFLIDAIFGFQFASLWSTLFFFLFVWTFERQRYVPAAAFAWLAASSHPLVGSAALGVYGLWVLRFQRERARPLITMAVPVTLAALPIFWMALQTPAATANVRTVIEADIIDPLVRRGSVYLLPFVLSAFAPQVRHFYTRVVPAMALVFVVGFIVQSGLIRYPGGPSGYYGVLHRSSDVYAAFFQSPTFQPGATYRVLEPSNRQDGMYRFMRRGARLSMEFFHESQYHRKWTMSQYQCYAATKGVDYVVVEHVYETHVTRSESRILEELTANGRARLVYADPAGRFKVYDIRAFASQIKPPKSLRACGIT